MTLPRRPSGLSRRVRLLPLSLAALALAGAPLVAQIPQIPLVNLLAEVEQQLTARKPADATGLLDEVIKRAQAGEALPAGINLERLLLTAANTNFQVQQYPRAAELGEALEKLPTVGATALAEARMIRGLSLALQQKYAEAVPVFKSAEDSTTYRDKALLYGAMSANQAGQLPVAIETYNRLLATSPRDRDWADAALTLIDIHLRAGNTPDARRGLALLRGNLGLVDNLAGLNLLSLQLGDALMKAGDNAGALAAFRNITTRDALVAEQKKRNAGLERALERYKGMTRPSATDADTIRRLNSRLEQAKASLEQVEKLAGFDATLRYRLAYTFQERGGVWEAALLYEDLIANYPESTERENAYFGLVRAYADAGRFDKVRDSVERFTRAYPQSKFGPQALYLAAMAAGQRNDIEGQLTFLGLATDKYGSDNALAEPMRLMRANALFTLARYAEAKEIVVAYAKDFPKGQFIEEARYLAAMADLAEGRASESEKQVRDYLKDYPEGRFVPDARYRLAAAAYAKQDYKECIELADKWLADYPPEQPQRGELHALRADALAGLGRIEDAIVAYHEALNLPLSDEQLGYVLDELTRHYQSRREYDAAVAMWEQFASERPDHPFVINAAYWISRIRNKEGKSEEALELVSLITRRYVNDPTRGDVERLLVEVAATLGRPPRKKKGEPKPEPVPEQVLFTRVNELLLVGNTRHNPTAQARALFTQSEIASIREKPALRDQLLSEIASKFAPDQLPPGILGKVGDALLAQGQPELAKKFYEQILAAHPKSIFADYGYVGLGEIALIEGNGDEAVARFNAAIDIAGARFKLKEATLGRARAQLLLGRMDAARELLEQVAGNRSWRGEATAEALFLLGEISLRRGTPDDLAKAQAHYQRIYLSYKRFPVWVSKAYLRSAETFEKLGQYQEALTTVNRFFTFRELEKFPEWQQAVALKPKLEARVPAASAAPVDPNAPLTVTLPASS
jgi:tetratricopeptide (TPR) repeat protein